MNKKVFVVSYVYQEGSGRPANRIAGIVESHDEAKELMNRTRGKLVSNAGKTPFTYDEGENYLNIVTTDNSLYVEINIDEVEIGMPTEK